MIGILKRITLLITYIPLIISNLFFITLLALVGAPIVFIIKGKTSSDKLLLFCNKNIAPGGQDMYINRYVKYLLN